MLCGSFSPSERTHIPLPYRFSLRSRLLQQPVRLHHRLIILVHQGRPAPSLSLVGSIQKGSIDMGSKQLHHQSSLKIRQRKNNKVLQKNRKHPVKYYSFPINITHLSLDVTHYNVAAVSLSVSLALALSLSLSLSLCPSPHAGSSNIQLNTCPGTEHV